MVKAVFSGTFDPMTKGHLDIISRCSSQFDQVVVAVIADSKVNTCMSCDSRIKSVRETCSDFDNIEVLGFSGLLVNFVESCNATVMVRSLRGVDDFQYEYRMSVMNKLISKNLDTIFFMSAPQVATISSTLVRQILANGGSVEKFVPPAVLSEIDKVNVWR